MLDSRRIYIENGAIVIFWTLAEDIIADSHCNGMVETDKGISSTVNTVANPFKEYKEYDWITGAARRYIISSTNLQSQAKEDPHRIEEDFFLFRSMSKQYLKFLLRKQENLKKRNTY